MMMSSSRSFTKTRTSFYKTLKSVDFPKKIKGISMDKHLPRKSFIEEEKGSLTERNFNNFYLQKPNMANTMDMSKCLSR